ncbi:Re/Si-specific NAD(P)(+) transhydrogenase subunit alpha [Oligella urethralis]|uniref:Re/Si-specific NAD(P)(+) transhydrogenase subunit alpha n=1 Tax=Oligella urethralis TaxID=90245 RepID=UPI00065F79EB|nr:Re/Si-specific NAD(P)(+) transhydrogenase subunit alpha [Oligella urethralis]
MRIGIPKEQFAGETRVAATPTTVTQLIKLGYDVAVESGAGQLAKFDDAAYTEAGASVVSRDDVFKSDIVYKINAPSDAEIDAMDEGTILVSFVQPAQNPELVEKLRAKKITAMAVDMVPRISRAQSMDVLSSMANISGYRAVIEAAHHFGRFFTGQITAAGKVPPAQVLVIGAGVAGLAAIGAAGSLGAIVKAFDTRLEVAEQIESMGGEFLKLDFPQESGGSGDGYAKVMSDEFIKAEMALFAEQAKVVDIIITTAAIPGKPSPKLITKEMVDSMKPGSVIVDLAALGGGNCEYTVPGEVFVTDNNVTVIGYTDLPNRLAGQSSQLYSTNLVNLSKLITPEKDGQAVLDFEDVIIRNMTVTHDGEVMFPPPPIQVSAAPQQAAPAAAPATKPEKAPKPLWQKLALPVIGVLIYLWASHYAPQEFLNHLTVFMLSCVVGYYVVWNVTHALHTPLMSVTNAISGIIIVGAVIQMSNINGFASFLTFISVFLVSINIFGGFYVTRRMLNMFRKG